MSSGAFPTAAGQPEAWNESGGSGTCSPNAAFVQAPLAVSGGTAYTARLQWKANRSDPGSIYAGAGPISTKFSPTSLAAILLHYRVVEGRACPTEPDAEDGGNDSPVGPIRNSGDDRRAAPVVNPYV